MTVWNLIDAVQRLDPEKVQLCIEAGVKVNSMSRLGQTPIQQFSAVLTNLLALSQLEEQGLVDSDLARCNAVKLILCRNGAKF